MYAATAMSANHPRSDVPSMNSQLSSRRVLGHVSPNVRLPPQKSISGSPLKRDLTAVVGSGSGFTYLKKRRLSPDRALSDTRQLEIQSVPTIQQGLSTESGTPTSPVDNEEDANDSSAGRRSFSSLINYDPSSQTAPQKAPQNVSHSHNDDAPSTLLFKSPSYAELLKLRLQIAMYKVRTDQIHLSFKDLKVQGEENNLPPDHTEVEQAVADLRAEAYRKQAQAQARSQAHPFAPTLLPAPVLRPPYNSPPVNARAAPMTFASTTPGGKGGPEEIELSSSVVKDRVAEGLMGLRHAA